MLLGGLVSSLVPNIWGLVSSLVPNIWWQEKEEPCSSDEERAWYRAQNVDEKETEHPPEPKLRRQTDGCGFVFPTPKVRADKPNSTASSSRDPGAVDRQFFENWARELEAEMKKEAEEIAMAEVWAQEIEMEAKKPRSGVPRAFLHGSVPKLCSTSLAANRCCFAELGWWFWSLAWRVVQSPWVSAKQW